MVKTQIFYQELQHVLGRALEEISSEKKYQEKCLLVLVHALQSYKECSSEEKYNPNDQRSYLFSKYQLMVSSVLMASIPRHFPGMRICFSFLSTFSLFYFLFCLIQLLFGD